MSAVQKPKRPLERDDRLVDLLDVTDVGDEVTFGGSTFGNCQRLADAALEHYRPAFELLGSLDAMSCERHNINLGASLTGQRKTGDYLRMHGAPAWLVELCVEAYEKMGPDDG